MAMLKTPTDSPKASAGKITPDSVRGDLHLNPKQGAQLDRIVLAGKRVMFSKESHAMMLEQLDGPGTLAQKLGQGVAGLIALLWQESRQSLPPELLIPSGMVLVAVAADFLRQAGQPVTDQDIGGGIEALVTALLQAGGVDPDKLAEAGGRNADSSGKMPPANADPAEAQPGATA